LLLLNQLRGVDIPADPAETPTRRRAAGNCSGPRRRAMQIAADA